MQANTPMSMWMKLPAERRRHLLWGLAGIGTSWSLAAVMALTTGASW